MCKNILSFIRCNCFHEACFSHLHTCVLNHWLLLGEEKRKKKKLIAVQKNVLSVFLVWFFLHLYWCSSFVALQNIWLDLTLTGNLNKSETSLELKGHWVFVESCPSVGSSSVSLLLALSLKKIKFLIHLIATLAWIYLHHNPSWTCQPVLHHQKINSSKFFCLA